MRRAQPIILVLIVTALVACSNKKEVKYAKESVYDTDFAVVYTAAVNATRELYPKLDDMPGRGVVRTAWHPVPLAVTQDDSQIQTNPAQSAAGMGSTSMTPGMQNAGMTTRMARTQQFVRFDVAVVGGRPWHVRVTGHAAEWQPGNAIPSELTGAARPPWLDGRTDALRVKIYRKLSKFAQKMPDEPEQQRPEDKLPKTDAATFANLPPAAAKELAAIKDALVRRDNGGLRAALADDVVWSLGADGGADIAMATWQADPQTLDEMAKLVTPKACGGDAKKVTCPAGEAEAGKWQLVLELRGADWRVTSFVQP